MRVHMLRVDVRGLTTARLPGGVLLGAVTQGRLRLAVHIEERGGGGATHMTRLRAHVPITGGDRGP
jgi:translation initiation factor 2 gamma subunit (eIF-2gamma)